MGVSPGWSYRDYELFGHKAYLIQNKAKDSDFSIALKVKPAEDCCARSARTVYDFVRINSQLRPVLVKLRRGPRIARVHRKLQYARAKGELAGGYF
jgi:hypothetical protein